MGQPEQPLREIQIDAASRSCTPAQHADPNIYAVRKNSPDPFCVLNESTTLGIRKGSPCNQDDNSHDGKRSKYSGQELPEDIWCHIHSLMTLRDAARASCVSHAFLCSWRYSQPHIQY
ncbi:hypothetical protein ACQ4PT_048141 [Festuca glaucescens]